MGHHGSARTGHPTDRPPHQKDTTQPGHRTEGALREPSAAGPGHHSGHGGHSGTVAPGRAPPPPQPSLRTDAKPFTDSTSSTPAFPAPWRPRQRGTVGAETPQPRCTPELTSELPARPQRQAPVPAATSPHPRLLLAPQGQGAEGEPPPPQPCYQRPQQLTAPRSSRARRGEAARSTSPCLALQNAPPAAFRCLRNPSAARPENKEINNPRQKSPPAGLEDNRALHAQLSPVCPGLPPPRSRRGAELCTGTPGVLRVPGGPRGALPTSAPSRGHGGHGVQLGAAAASPAPCPPRGWEQLQ